MSPNRHRTLLNMINDSEHRSALIKFLESCILIKNANGNILPPWDTSRCWQAAWEDLLKCHNFVTLDSSAQDARFHVPLLESAVGPASPVYEGAQSPESYFGGFFCARLARQLQTVAGQGHLRVRRFLRSGLAALFGPPPCQQAWVVGNRVNGGFLC